VQLGEINGAFLLSTLLAAAAAAWFSYILLAMALRAKEDTSHAWEFEKRRRITLRKHSLVYRWFEPLVDELAAGPLGCGSQSPELERLLPLAFPKVPWKATEFLTVKRLEGIAVALFGLVIGSAIGGWTFGLVMASLGLWGYPQLMVRDAFERAGLWKRQLLHKLPYTIDLIAVMMEAGATLTESMKTATQGGRDHPLDQELAKLLYQLELGRPSRESLAALADRVDDDSVRELVTAMIKGEDLGAPLSKVLRRQSDDLLLRRWQWAEKASAEAQVRIVFPGMLIMIACLLIVLSPFVLPLFSR